MSRKQVRKPSPLRGGGTNTRESNIALDAITLQRRSRNPDGLMEAYGNKAYSVARQMIREARVRYGSAVEQ
jgi:hypothetical protein